MPRLSRVKIFSGICPASLHLYTLNKRNCVSQNTPIRVQSKKIAKLPFNLYMLRAGSMVFRTCGRSDQARKSTFFNRSARLKACWASIETRVLLIISFRAATPTNLLFSKDLKVILKIRPWQWGLLPKKPKRWQRVNTSTILLIFRKMWELRTAGQKKPYKFQNSATQSVTSIKEPSLNR